MASHPLVTGFKAAPPIKARLVLNAIPGDGCLESFDAMREWIEDGVVEFVVQSNEIVYGSAGTLDAATIEDRNAPRLMFDEEGRCLGFALWSPDAKQWVRSGAPGEILTIFRTEGTVERDMEVKLLKGGWRVCDGSLSGVPDLSPDAGQENAHFKGAPPEWDVYTVGKVL